MKTGFVAILGKPNVGKSTIINSLLERKLSIVTNKSQTTRQAIKGVYNDEESQIVFVDTPGIHKTSTSLGAAMNKEALKSSKGVDVIVLVVDASKSFNAGDEFIKKNVNKDANIIIVINKIDLVKLPEAKAMVEKYKEEYPSAKIIEASAIQNFNIDTLLIVIKSFLNEGPKYYAEDFFTDKDASFFVSEVIREKILKLLKQEVPHNIAVKVDNIKHKAKAVYIEANIIVSKDSHKGIVIGKSGSMIKKIGTFAREDLEEYFSKRIFLELYVKVEEDWLNNSNFLKEIGF